MKRSLSSIGLHSFQGIRALPQMPKCVNHVSGIICKLSVDKHRERSPEGGFFFCLTVGCLLSAARSGHLAKRCLHFNLGSCGFVDRLEDS
jgi:hypothetical protein